ncbi:VOC family protein [Priestia aryabhattai]|uniref:VOC family protein n=1 Tax=Priestia TaxID=2800373 RepID=UPI0012A78C40|nr:MULTISPECIES: VOC family protein [Priestia]MED3919135.1 VOC family protein [Priestia aryabhattai]NGY90678.1 VOC family protein [Priestia megaterium]QFY72712.1 glyoxalase [Priestia megaterium]
MNPILNEVGTIFIPVEDIQKARDWYCDVLGLPVDGDILYDHLYVIPMNGTGIVLDSKTYSKNTLFKTPAFHLNTNDIKEAYEYMKQKKVELTTGIEHDHWFIFKDPDGNHLMVCEC